MDILYSWTVHTERSSLDSTVDPSGHPTVKACALVLRLHTGYTLFKRSCYAAKSVHLVNDGPLSFDTHSDLQYIVHGIKKLI